MTGFMKQPATPSRDTKDKIKVKLNILRVCYGYIVGWVSLGWNELIEIEFKKRVEYRLMLGRMEWFHECGEVACKRTGLLSFCQLFQIVTGLLLRKIFQWQLLSKFTQACLLMLAPFESDEAIDNKRIHVSYLSSSWASISWSSFESWASSFEPGTVSIVI